jgi:hypothetical protein
MLHITSCLFATIPIHAFYTRMAAYHHVFLLVTVLSILFHTTKHPAIKYVDTIAAHGAFLFMLAETRHEPYMALFPLAVACLWFGQAYVASDTAKNALHACLHAVSIVGAHAFILRFRP